MKKWTLFLFLILTIASCKRDPLKVNLSNVSMEPQILRFDTAFFETPLDRFSQRLPEIQNQFPEFFMAGQTDSSWAEVRRDSMLNSLYKKVAEKYPNISALRPDIISVLKHRAYYFPSVHPDVRVITYISGLDWEYAIINADSVFFVGIDLFLGEDTVYSNFPYYIAKRLSPEFLGPKMAVQAARPYVNRDPRDGSFLNQMLHYGRTLYIAEAFLPEVESHRILEYTAEEMQWCLDNETDVWTFFVEEELIFKNDKSLHDRFLAEAPFSKFYKKIDRESPGRIGQWIGWRIVHSYMEAHPETTIQELAQWTDARAFFQQAQYKPF
jgi:hypothetical protein